MDVANPKYKGVRKRKWGRWVSEIRLPNSRERIWLGSFDSPIKAARAFDAAMYCLRGPEAQFNFPDNPPVIPGGMSLPPNEIQAVASRFANEKTADDEEQEEETAVELESEPEPVPVPLPAGSRITSRVDIDNHYNSNNSHLDNNNNVQERNMSTTTTTSYSDGPQVESINDGDMMFTGQNNGIDWSFLNSNNHHHHHYNQQQDIPGSGFGNLNYGFEDPYYGDYQYCISNSNGVTTDHPSPSDFLYDDAGEDGDFSQSSFLWNF